MLYGLEVPLLLRDRAEVAVGHLGEEVGPPAPSAVAAAVIFVHVGGRSRHLIAGEGPWISGERIRQQVLDATREGVAEVLGSLHHGHDGGQASLQEEEAASMCPNKSAYKNVSFTLFRSFVNVQQLLASSLSLHGCAAPLSLFAAPFQARKHLPRCSERFLAFA